MDLNEEPFISPFKLPIKEIVEFNFIKSAVKSRIMSFVKLDLFLKFLLKLGKFIFLPDALYN